jgi:hypothetical protein
LDIVPHGGVRDILQAILALEQECWIAKSLSHKLDLEISAHYQSGTGTGAA